MGRGREGYPVGEMGLVCWGGLVDDNDDDGHDDHYHFFGLRKWQM